MADRNTQSQQPAQSPALVGLLAWLIPGAGHFYLGMRTRGIVLFVAICSTFWVGVAIGGVRSTVDPHGNWHWFLAEFAAGLNTFIAMAINRVLSLTGAELPARSFLKTRDIGIVYAGVAGLLNVLAIFDAVVRGLAGNVHELEPEPAEDQST